MERNQAKPGEGGTTEFRGRDFREEGKSTRGCRMVQEDEHSRAPTAFSSVRGVGLRREALEA